jgi:glycosyltransferase involved in cell wall biosynthesis
MEEELIDCVDGFVATSRDLEKKGRRCRAALYLPHGVDFEHFQRDQDALEPVPELETLPRPIVGFFGLIAPWIDLGVIAALGRAFPKLSFVLIGKALVGMEQLAGLPNVHFLGMVPYERLPAYARDFSVGLIPFAKNELTEAVNPLKLLEYYALGLPVVATRLRELEGLAGPLYLASDQAEFRAQVERVLTGASGDREAALAVARQNTWQQRAEQLSCFLESLL